MTWLTRCCLFTLMTSLLIITGCHDTQYEPIVSFKTPTHIQYVETENIQWGVTDEEDQEIDDEI